MCNSWDAKTTEDPHKKLYTKCKKHKNYQTCIQQEIYKGSSAELHFAQNGTLQNTSAAIFQLTLCEKSNKSAHCSTLNFN